MGKAGVMLDVDFVRSQFPAFDEATLRDWRFFENAGGSYACRQTIDALVDYYKGMKLQPYGRYPASAMAGQRMERSHERWAEALGVQADEVHFGPSTSMNTYVLGKAFSEVLGPGDEVIVTNQDHESNTGAVRRAADSVGATTHEWRVDASTGLLDPEVFGSLLNSRTRLVSIPHASNIVGIENDVQLLTAMAHESGARIIVDGVSFAPHSLANIAELNPDVYLFSLYKTYSVHQGLMVVRNGLIDDLPNQGHYFNAALSSKRLTPAGPDHAQIASAGAVLDYVEVLAQQHGQPTDSVRQSVEAVSRLWRDHETRLLGPLLERLRAIPELRLIGPDRVDGSDRLHRCPTVAFALSNRHPAEVVDELAKRQIMASSGHFYARRLIEAADLDAETGVVRVSFVHYTTMEDVLALGSALEEILG